MVESVAKAYKPWLIASLAVLIGSLGLLAIAGTIAFVYYAATGMPIWLVLLGVVAVLGLALGFGGFFLIMMTAGWQSFRQSRRVQVLPPERDEANK